LAFKSLKAHIANQPVLQLSDFNKEFVLQRDARNEGIEAILLQEDSGVKHPIVFVSKKLLPRKRNYSTIEKECLAIVWAVEKLELPVWKTVHSRNRSSAPPIFGKSSVPKRTANEMGSCVTTLPFRDTGN